MASASTDPGNRVLIVDDQDARIVWKGPWKQELNEKLHIGAGAEVGGVPTGEEEGGRRIIRPFKGTTTTATPVFVEDDPIFELEFDGSSVGVHGFLGPSAFFEYSIDGVPQEPFISQKQPLIADLLFEAVGLTKGQHRISGRAINALDGKSYVDYLVVGDATPKSGQTNTFLLDNTSSAITYGGMGSKAPGQDIEPLGGTYNAGDANGDLSDFTVQFTGTGIDVQGFILRNQSIPLGGSKKVILEFAIDGIPVVQELEQFHGKSSQQMLYHRESLASGPHNLTYSGLSGVVGLDYVLVTDNSADDNNGSRLSKGGWIAVIVGAVVLGVLLCLSAVFFILWIRKRRKRSKHQKHMQWKDSFSTTPASQMSSLVSSYRGPALASTDSREAFSVKSPPATSMSWSSKDDCILGQSSLRHASYN